MRASASGCHWQSANNARVFTEARAVLTKAGLGPRPINALILFRTPYGSTTCSVPQQLENPIGTPRAFSSFVLAAIPLIARAASLVNPPLPDLLMARRLGTPTVSPKPVPRPFPRAERRTAPFPLLV